MSFRSAGKIISFPSIRVWLAVYFLHAMLSYILEQVEVIPYQQMPPKLEPEVVPEHVDWVGNQNFRCTFKTLFQSYVSHCWQATQQIPV